ncbi:unnamed protein product [Rotaria sordida]|uniref:FAM65 N-terminal domain-containing protein n=1 Tax=Rotaria sordida TaxID=392033 RepID=A0A814ES62_9BILA|nr:unnamed protein product [Rotaria sordida]CAF1583294.1 unnamed protein product [Rotaria sordida]
MSTNRLTPFNKRTMPTNNNTHTIPDILGHEQIDLTRLKKQAQLTQTQIPKIPRITRTLNTLENVLKVLQEHSRTSKYQIDQLIESVEKENHQLARINIFYFSIKDTKKKIFFFSIFFFLKQLHESQVAYLKLQAHTASLQSLKECYCRYAHMLDVKLGLKECTKTLCAIEAQLEAMLGTFVLNLQEISGFSRICPGDEYELIIPDLLLIKISEVKLLGVSLKTIGTKCFEVNNFYSMEIQRMIINANQSGTLKLIFLANWDLYDQVDTKFTFYNPNRTYSDVTRTWSMFVGNTTLLRTVNDTLTSSSPSSSSSQYSSKRLSTFCPISSQETNEYVTYNSTTDESNHYDEIDIENKYEQIPKEEICDNIHVHDDTHSSSNSSSFAAGLNSDEISSAASIDYCQTEAEGGEEEEVENESIYELVLLIDQVRTCLDDLRLIDRSFSIIFDKIEHIINNLDKIIKNQIHEQTEKTLEIENILTDFNFLNTFDDEDTLKTIDSGFEGEQQQHIKQNENFKSNINQPINTIFIDILNRILILLYYIQNRSKSDDNLILERLNEQYEQLNMAISWCENQVQDVKQALSQCDQSIIEFWSKCCSNETFIVSFERCLNEIMKYLNCNQDIAEYLLNNLCYLSFRINFVHPKFLTLIQIWFLLKKDQSDIDKDIQIANEQIELSKNLSNLILNNNYTQIALMLNRRTLNNNEFINRILYEYDFKIPDELIGMLLTSIRYDVISHLRTTLLSHNDNPYFIMGKQNRAIAQKAKVKQQQNNKKPKPVKTNLKRLNERVRNKVEQVDKLYDNKSNEKKQKMETTKQDTSSVDNK